jgi:hypothetical protein
VIFFATFPQPLRNQLTISKIDYLPPGRFLFILIVPDLVLSGPSKNYLQNVWECSMSVKTQLRSDQRFVLYISNTLRTEIEHWVEREDMSLAEFGREAFEYYLTNKKKEERDRQLAETCKLFKRTNSRVMIDWGRAEGENWAS